MHVHLKLKGLLEDEACYKIIIIFLIIKTKKKKKKKIMLLYLLTKICYDYRNNILLLIKAWMSQLGPILSGIDESDNNLRHSKDIQNRTLSSIFCYFLNVQNGLYMIALMS